MIKLKNIIKVIFNIVFTTLSIATVAQTTFTESATVYNLNIGGSKDGGHAWADYDLDGDYDLVINTNGRGYLLRNDGGSFTDVTNINGNLAPDFLGGGLERTALFVDFNNDGYPDVFRNDSNQARIYLQDPATNKFGDGTGGTAPNQTFNSSNIADGFNSEGAGALDFDGDGDLDIFIDNHNFGIDILLNDGTGNFTHATAKSASPNPPYNIADPTTWPLGLVQDATDGDYGSATDFNNDGWVDIVVRKRNQVDLFTNLGGTFGNEINIDDANNSNKGSVAFQDFDNDGDFDLFWTENGANQIHRNNGDGTWTALGAATGIPINFPGQIEGLACGDVDNDGDIDIFLANGSNGGSQTGKLYLNQINNGGGAMSFVDSGLTFPNRGEGCTFIDIDNDGDLDLYMNRNSTNRLFINNLPVAARADHLYINIKEDRDAFGLINTEKRFGIGATATLLDCDGTVISGIREVNGGYGHGTQEPGVIHFGLPSGPNTPIVLEVSYPRTVSGRVVVRQQITPIDFNNGSINIVEILPNILNQPPIAQDDLITVTQGGTVTFNPLADNGNGVDTDPEGTPLTVLSITQPPLTEGIAVLNGDGTVTYSPGAFSGATFFTYTVRDNDPACALLAEETIGTVLVTVNTDNDGDGINNDVDLDDDNDGIPDIDENLNCNGTTVNNVFVDENYGAGNRGTLPFTNYCYEDGSGTNPCTAFPGNVNVNDGEYALLQFAAPYNINTGGSSFGSWLTIGDHTGNANGRMAVYNAAIATGQFYNRPVSSLIANVDVNINFWALNLLQNGTGGILPNITIEIRDLSNNLIFTSTTGNIPENNNWNNYSYTFNPGNNTELRFILINNAPGGGGNDLALDDIEIAQILCDTDGDGIANQFDLDSDNDGVYDIVEGGALAQAGVNDTDNDGIIDGVPATFGSNGLFNGIENNDTSSAILTYTIAESSDDTDTIPNYLDLDADGDGIPDNVEAQSTIGYTAPSGTVNVNGVFTNYTSGLNPINTDGTDQPDYLDTDSDNEGSGDTAEAGITLSGSDIDNDGLDDATDADITSYADPGGTIDNPLTLPVILRDTDADATTGGDVDFRDALDNRPDHDNDGIVDALDFDDDNDGILDTDEGCGNLIINGNFEQDDFTDPIAFPGGFTGVHGTFIGTTYNNNTLAGWTYTQNMDGWVEGGTWASAFDGNQYLDLIGNNNVTGGISNELIQIINTVPGKGYTFSFYWGEDIGHQPPEIVTLDFDIIDSGNNSIINGTLTTNAIGPIGGILGPNHWFYFEQTFIATTTQTTVKFTATPPGAGDTSAGAALDFVSVVLTSMADCVDTDNDGIIDSFDLDSDNDGIYDAVEAGHNQIHTNGVVNGTVGTDGVPDSVQSTPNGETINYVVLDSDGDGNIDVIELDSDNDTCKDVNEAGYTDNNNDGILANVPTIVDGNGRVTGTNTIDGYTTPADNNSNSIFDFQEVGAIPTIDSQPSNQIICAGDNGSFNVVASGTNLLYQWQISTDDGANFSNLSDGGIYSGTNTVTLTITGTTEGLDKNQYRVIVSSQTFVCDTIISNAVVLTIPDVSYTLFKIDPTTCGGNNGLIVFNGLASSTVYSIVFIDDGTTIGPTNYTSNASGQVVLSGLDAGLYTGIVASLSGCSGPALTQTLDDPVFPDAPTSGGNITVCEQNPIQTIVATANAPAGSTVVWYDSSSGGNIVAIPELNTQGTITYYAESLNTTTNCVSAIRTAVVLTIEQCLADLSLNKIVNNASPNQGDNITFTLTVGNAGPSTATTIIVKDILPTNFSYTHPNYTTTTGTVTFDAVTREFIWNLGAYILPVNNTISLTYTLTVDNCGEFTNQTEITNSSLLDTDSTLNNGN